MKRFLGFILLICHMNSSMFLPQVAEQDRFDTNGNQVDDINSVIEFVRVELGFDNTSDDEDDDNGQPIQLLKVIHFYCQQTVEMVYLKPTLIELPAYSAIAHSKLASICFDIITPPPEA